MLKHLNASKLQCLKNLTLGGFRTSVFQDLLNARVAPTAPARFEYIGGFNASGFQDLFNATAVCNASVFQDLFKGTAAQIQQRFQQMGGLAV
jgi:hypothetical protein